MVSAIFDIGGPLSISTPLTNPTIQQGFAGNFSSFLSTGTTVHNVTGYVQYTGQFSSFTSGTATGYSSWSTVVHSGTGGQTVTTTQIQNVEFEYSLTELIAFNQQVEALQAQGMATEQLYLNRALEIFSGNDLIVGGASNYELLGFAGNDTISGASAILGPDDGNDVILGNEGADLIFGCGGDDILLGGSDLVDNGDAANEIWGGVGNDSIYGGGSSDTLYGEAGNDLIFSGQGNDTLRGGEGADIYVLMQQSGTDTIIDFAINADVLSIQRTATVYDFASAVAHGVSDANGSYIGTGQGGGVILAGVQLDDLQAVNLYFYG